MTVDNISTIFAALADPTRRAILDRLSRGDTNVTELAEPFSMSMPAITKHLKVLESAGLISRGRDAQRRPCHLEPVPLQEISAWVEQYRELWDSRLNQLENYLAELQSPKNP